jgi:hypothetical protein
MNNNLFKCDRCGKILIDEEYDSHLCSPVPSGSKKIVIDYYQIVKDNLGQTVIVAKDLNGVIYRLIKREQKFTDKIPVSDESLQHSGSDGDLTEP